MTDLTPPDVPPLDDAARARIRARIAAEPTAPRDGARRWLAPAGAAAAVLLIAGAVGWSALASGGEQQTSTSPRSTAAAESPVTSAPTESLERCQTYAGRRIDDARAVVAVAMRDGSAFVLANDERSLVCDDNGGILTAHRVRPAQTPLELTRTVLGFSTSVYLMNPRDMKVSYVAGGRLPDGVTGLRYTWPGGDVVDAAVVSDDQGRSWWLMAHAPEDGPLTDPRQNRLDLDPVVVEVTRDGVVDEVVLHWGRDDCSHVNHGC